MNGTADVDGFAPGWLGVMVEQAACGAPVGSPLTSTHPRMLLTISTLIVSATYYLNYYT